MLSYCDLLNYKELGNAIVIKERLSISFGNSKAVFKSLRYSNKVSI